jgi:NTE family protein
MWKVFQREGVEFSMAIGSSAGSIYAAFMALGYDRDCSETMTMDFWTHDLMDGYVSNLRAAMSGRSRFTQRSGLIDDRPVVDRLHHVFGDRTFADAQLPLYIVSTDFYSGEPVVQSTGTIVNAVRASIAIPMIFPLGS